MKFLTQRVTELSRLLVGPGFEHPSGQITWFKITSVHDALRLISQDSQQGSTVYCIIRDCW